jgi:thiamine-monophosphate kinase
MRSPGPLLRREAATAVSRRSASRPGKQESAGEADAVHRGQRTIAREVGEFDLIGRLAAALGDAGPAARLPIGDDAAVLEPDIVVSTDLLVEDVHVRRATSAPADIGWKALAAAVSDLAAMGADPLGAVIGLALGAAWSEDEAVAVYEGVAACAAATGCPVVGGDVSRAPVLMLAVTVLGRALAPVTRAGARPGDVLAVTGELGGSEAGRLVLEGAVPPPPGAAALEERHRRPRPRLAEGRALAGIVHAMLDVSDGVASDARRLAEASGVAVELDLAALPLQTGVAAVAVAQGIAPGAFAATGGEDYELLVALPEAALAAASVPLTAIGRVVDGPLGVRFTGPGAEAGLQGFDHLRP